MNLKLTNEMRSSVNLIHTDKKSVGHSIKEERRRTGRYIAILVGISLFLLAIYHAWVRRIPIVASLVVPALIMFVYVGWVLYTASRDKHRMLDAEAAFQAAQEADMEALNEAQNNVEISIISSKDTSKTTSPVSTHREWAEISSALKEVTKDETPSLFVTPLILVNDKPVEKTDLQINHGSDQKWSHLVETVVANEKLKGLQTRRKLKRKFCRSKRSAVFKRSYSIA